MPVYIYSFCRRTSGSTKPAESSANISSRLCENASCASLFIRSEACKKYTVFIFYKHFEGKADKMNIYATAFIPQPKKDL